MRTRSPSAFKLAKSAQQVGPPNFRGSEWLGVADYFFCEAEDIDPTVRQQFMTLMPSGHGETVIVKTVFEAMGLRDSLAGASQFH